MFGNIYKNKRVLVTGHTGFKGAWLALWLTQLGAKVIGYSLAPPTNPNLFESLRLQKKIKHIIGDIRDSDHLEKVFRQHRPEMVFHLAAQALVKESYENPRETFETNVIGTTNIFEAVRKSSTVKVVLNITSDKCYENKEWHYDYRENDPLGGRDPYSLSKACSELVTVAYRQSFLSRIGIASARAGNVIGGGDWGEDRLVPDCVKALASGKKIVLRNPHSTRPWQFIFEPLSGYLWLGALLMKEPVKYSEAWNFGPKDDDILSVKQVTKEVIKIWPKSSFKIKIDKFYESSLLKLDINKARHFLGWRPVFGVNQAIRKTLDWYQRYYAKETNMLDFSLEQIKEYEEQARTDGLDWSRE